MPEEAGKKGHYRELRQMVMGGRLDFDDDSFDAVISVGVLSQGHASAIAVNELVRVTKPGGHLIYTLRPDLYESHGFKEVHEALERDGKCRLVEASDPIQMLAKGEPTLVYQVRVYEVTG
jgi:SAM-dependent methyltransferase